MLLGASGEAEAELKQVQEQSDTALHCRSPALVEEKRKLGYSGWGWHSERRLFTVATA